MQKKFLTYLFALSCLSVLGCAATPSLNRLRLQMDKDEIRAILGENFTARGGKIDPQGNTLEIWEYYDVKDKTTYQIYFLNNKVAQWGRPADITNFPALYPPRADTTL